MIMLSAEGKIMSPTLSDKFQFILGRRSIRVYGAGDVGKTTIVQLL